MAPLQKGGEEIFKAEQRREKADEIQQVQGGGLGVHGGAKDRKDQRQKPGEERAPVGVNGVVPVVAQVGGSEVEIVGSVRAEGKTRCPGF